MKPLHYAIASIVDAHTGFGLHGQAAAADYRPAEDYGQRIRSRSLRNLLGSLGRGLGKIPAALRARSERRRKIREVASLSDRQLDDIGLNRGDVIALQYGMLELAQLEARRIENLGSKRVRLYRDTPGRSEAPRHALNDAVFARARCA